MQKLLVVIVSIVTALLFSLSLAHSEVVINLKAIKTIESDGNPYAFNLRTKCYGVYQISEICLQECNEIHSTNYEPEDLFNPLVNETIAAWYFKRVKQMLDFYEIPVSITTVIASYNWGIGNVVKWYRKGASFEQLPQETRRYIEKYQRINTAKSKIE